MPSATSSHAGSAADAKTQNVAVSGDKIAYRAIGEGTPLVMATRFRGTLDTWDPLFLDELAKHHRVITFDYPGIGYSSGTLPSDMHEVATFVAEFADAIGLQVFALLGWSWGGLVAQTLLLEQPQRVTHAILVGTVPPGKNEFPMQQVFIDRAMKPINDLADEEVLFFEPKSAFSRQAARQSHERIYAWPGVTARIPASVEQFQRYFKAAEGFRQDAEGRRDKLMESRIPLLIICGDNDTSTPGQNWFPLAGRLANAQLLMYSQAGHAPQHQLPVLSAQYISNFVALTPRDVGSRT